MADLASKPAAYMAHAGLDTQSSAHAGSAAEYQLSNHPMAIREAAGGRYRLGSLFSNAIGSPTAISIAK